MSMTIGGGNTVIEPWKDPGEPYFNSTPFDFEKSDPNDVLPSVGSWSDTTTFHAEKLRTDESNTKQRKPTETYPTYALAIITTIGILLGLSLFIVGSSATSLIGGCGLVGLSLFSLIHGVISFY